MSEKLLAILPKEVADGIEHIKKTHKLGFVYDLEGIRSEFQNLGEPYGALVRWATDSRENMIIYFYALVNGYEVEQTPEDKVREYYKQINPDSNCGRGSRCAIRETLTILNIKIDGVNA